MSINYNSPLLLVFFRFNRQCVVYKVLNVWFYFDTVCDSLHDVQINLLKIVDLIRFCFRSVLFQIENM